MQALILAMALQAAPEPMPPPPTVDPPVEVAHGVFVMRGARQAGRGPDGVTTFMRTPNGLLVVDTGRHVWHSDAILAFARAQNRPITAIVNTHWHLDHSSGNRRIKAAFPNARVYTTNAVARALAEGGFLARDAANIPTYLADPNSPEIRKDEIRIFADTMAHSEGLRPDVVLTHSRSMRIGGRRLDVHVTNHAVTDADVWLYDRSTHVAVVGDLVTLYAPFFETACPLEWAQALDEVWATPFTIAIPGHGPPMSRDDFNAYRTSFRAFVDCVRSDADADQCASGWTSGITSLVGDDPQLRAGVTANANYYVGMLREHGGKSTDCQLAG